MVEYSKDKRVNNVLNHIDGYGQPRYWKTAKDGKKAFDDVIKNEGNLTDNHIANRTRQSLYFDYNPYLGLISDYFKFNKLPYTDKYKHAVMNCKAAQYGNGGVVAGQLFSGLKEFFDVSSKRNTRDASNADDYANKIGRYLGYKYPQGDCEEIVGEYIKKYNK